MVEHRRQNHGNNARYRVGRSVFNLAGRLWFALALLSGSVGLVAEAQDRTQDRAADQLIIAFGDSLTAGYELPPEASFPAQLEDTLQAQGHRVRVQNAGVSGDTSTGGRSRLDWVLPAPGSPAPDLVIVELGANDALRGIDPALTRQNLDAILTSLKDRDIPVLLAGMLAPPSMGRDYEERFNPIYPELADKHDIPLYPFFLDGVAANKNLNLDDGMHPTAEGVGIIVDRILPLVTPFLDPPES